MTTLDEWISQDARRRAPEFDFGTQWTREHDPDTEWAVTYNTGTGELYARTRSGNDVEVLGQFADPQDVADAVPDWGRRSMQSGSLDWIRREATALHTATPEPDHREQPTYGILLNADGHAHPLDRPQTIEDVIHRIGTDPDLTLDVARVNTGDRTDRVIMWVDDDGHRKNLPVNAAATAMYGTGWPILGDAVIVTDDKSPLPTHVVDQLVRHTDIDVDGIAVPERDRDAALDWDEHLDDRERSDTELGLDDEADLDIADLQPDADAAIPHPEQTEHELSAGEMDIAG